MKLTYKGSYVLRLVLDIARHSDIRYISSHDIIKRQNISQSCIWKLLKRLTKKGIIKSNTGPDGGYFLSKKPEDINVYNILLAVGEVINYTEELDKPEEVSEEYLAVAEFFTDLDRNMNEYLKSITLADLLKISGEE